MTTTNSTAAFSDPCAERAQRDWSVWNPQRLKVSPHDGDVLAAPAFDEIETTFRDNTTLFAQIDHEIQGVSWKELRQQAREEMIDLAVDYTSRIRQQPVAHPSVERVACDGHQPLLFHSGVWAKNFVLYGLSQKFDAVPLHLIVDNDAATRTGIQVPCGSVDHPVKQSIDYCHLEGDRPWEGLPVTDAALFESFADRVTAAMRSWDIQPLINECWPAAVSASQRGESLPDCLTAARHQMEREWGIENLELPLSVACETASFRRFFCHMISHLPCFRELYNEVLGEYRTFNKIRSQTHPVPELKSRDGWLEAPFWIWNSESTSRQPLFVKQEDHLLLLAAGEKMVAKLELSAESDVEKALVQLQEMHESGWRLRSRALTTTLFSRLFLSDLFIHGIGGAKYDEMTDRLIERFYGLTAPGYMTLSGTWHLPLRGVHDITEKDLQDVQRQLRDLEHNPERVLLEELPPQAEELVTEKQKLISEQHRIEQGERIGETQREHHRRGCQRYRRLHEINQQLSEYGKTRRRGLEQQAAEIEEKLAANQILKNREYSFVLFPQDKLRSALTTIVN